MKNKKFRKALDAYLEEMGFNKTRILDDASYDNSIVGITDEGILVYSFNKMIKEYMKDNECEELDAIEWIEYNTIRALPYLGEGKPIIIMETPKTLIEKY